MILKIALFLFAVGAIMYFVGVGTQWLVDRQLDRVARRLQVARYAHGWLCPEESCGNRYEHARLLIRHMEMAHPDLLPRVDAHD